MDLGIQVEPQLGFSYDEIVAIGRAGEKASFSRLWLSDHLFLNADAVRTDCLEAWTTLAALARDLKTIRIGAMVTCQSYRNPALLAKIAAGVDRLSGGRLEFGIGAGWKQVEYGPYGYEFPPPAIRVDELVDTIEICTRLWTQDRATYAGTRYSVTGAPCSPKPIQHPLPLWVGGAKPRVLRIAAKYASWLNHGGPGVDVTLAGIGTRQRLVDEACRAAKRDPASLHRSAFLTVVAGSTSREVDAIVSDLAGRAKQTSDQWRTARPTAIIGTPDEVIARLREYAAIGIEHANVILPYTREIETIELLGRAVVAAIR
jgi:alkanesulfonate monooxygenase SsuD/methylene tetrahydromethanopterin reductase-like flavin-dependent oxidoreductase (luciferase family)